MLGGDTQAAHHVALIGIARVVVTNGVGEQRELGRQQQRHDRCPVVTRVRERWSKTKHDDDVQLGFDQQA